MRFKVVLQGVAVGSLLFFTVYTFSPFGSYHTEEVIPSVDIMNEKLEIESNSIPKQQRMYPYAPKEAYNDSYNGGQWDVQTSTLGTTISSEKISNNSLEKFHLVPEDIKRFAPRLFEVFPEKFDDRFKNPCWYQGTTLRCVPYFYLIGMPKCGTTDLWDKIVQHPQVQGVPKEPHWWARRRLGWKATPIHGPQVQKIRKMTGTGDDSSVEWYLNWFSTFAVPSIQKSPDKVFGDGSVTTAWDLRGQWENLFPDADEPPYVLADLIHALQPQAKIVIILREPVSRQYSSYLYCGGSNALGFHNNVVKNLKCEENCERNSSKRYCAYKAQCGLFRGTYSVFLEDWIKAYGRDKIHVVMLSEWMTDSVNQYKKLIHFLDLGMLPDEQIESILLRSVKNSQKGRKKKAGPMQPDTEKLLRDFYRPWNHKLADLLNDTRFLWDY